MRREEKKIKLFRFVELAEKKEQIGLSEAESLEMLRLQEELLHK